MQERYFDQLKLVSQFYQGRNIQKMSLSIQTGGHSFRFNKATGQDLRKRTKLVLMQPFHTFHILRAVLLAAKPYQGQLCLPGVTGMLPLDIKIQVQVLNLEWNWLSRQVVEALPLYVFKCRLDKLLSGTIQIWVVMP